jgi:hypothetical protein
MSKIYFSRSMTRTMSADHPVGDPTGGAAYGEKNDPISAAISLATMYGTASAGFAAMTVMQGITFAGAAMSLVGNVTGNKTLSKIGMITGIAGGIGSFAESKGLFSSGNLKESLGMGTPAASNTGTAATAMQSKGGSLSQSQAQGTVTASEQAARNAEMLDASKNTAAARTNLTGSPDGMVRGTAGQYINTPVNASNASSGLTGGSSYTSGTYNASLPGKADLTGAYMDVPYTTAEPGFFSKAWEATKGVGSEVMDFTKTNPYGAMAIGQTAQPIADYLSGKTDAEIEALESQTGYADARSAQMQEEIAREKRRRANLNAGYGQVNTGINVNPAAVAQAQAGGLISGAMQPA